MLICNYCIRKVVLGMYIFEGNVWIYRKFLVSVIVVIVINIIGIKELGGVSF